MRLKIFSQQVFCLLCVMALASSFRAHAADPTSGDGLAPHVIVIGALEFKLPPGWTKLHVPEVVGAGEVFVALQYPAEKKLGIARVPLTSFFRSPGPYPRSHEEWAAFFKGLCGQAGPRPIEGSQDAYRRGQRNRDWLFPNARGALLVQKEGVIGCFAQIRHKRLKTRAFIMAKGHAPYAIEILSYGFKPTTISPFIASAQLKK